MRLFGAPLLGSCIASSERPVPPPPPLEVRHQAAEDRKGEDDRDVLSYKIIGTRFEVRNGEILVDFNDSLIQIAAEEGVLCVSQGLEAVIHRRRQFVISQQTCSRHSIIDLLITLEYREASRGVFVAEVMFKFFSRNDPDEVPRVVHCTSEDIGQMRLRDFDLVAMFARLDACSTTIGHPSP